MQQGLFCVVTICNNTMTRESSSFVLGVKCPVGYVSRVAPATRLRLPKRIERLAGEFSLNKSF